MPLNEEKKDRSSDRPVLNLDDDLLGVEQFARNVAKAVRVRKGRDSFVISLQGPWGNGKSSIKNMILDSLRREANPPYIIEFEPWQYRDRDSLFEGFFREVAIATGGDDDKGAERASLLSKYSGQISVVGGAVDVVGEAVSLVNPIAGKGFSFLGKTLKRAGASTKEAAEVLASKGKTLNEIKNEVRASMFELNRPVLIVIDDIDRLFADEMAQVFQLVKANADFPNFIYLLLFQRDVVEKGLEKVISGNGQDYLEKIIQMPITVPLLDKQKIQDLLLSEIRLLVELYEVTISETEFTYVEDLVAAELRPYLTNLRSVRRLVNALDLSLPVFITEHDIDVSLGDLLGLEALRLSEPTVYECLPNLEDLLMGKKTTAEYMKEYRRQNGSSFPDIETAEDSSLTTLKELVSLVPPERQRAFRHLMDRLFPSASIGRTDPQDENLDPKERQYSGFKRPQTKFPVGQDQYFDRYFRFALSPNEFKEATVTSIINQMDNREWLRSKFVDLATQRKMDTLFSRLGARVQEISEAKSVTCFAVIAELIDEWALAGDTKRVYETNNPALSFTKKSVLAHPDTKQRVILIEKMLKSTKAIYMTTDLVYDLKLSFERRYAGAEPDVDVDDMPKIVSSVMVNIQNAIKNGNLSKSFLWRDILYHWASFAPEDAHDWFKNWIQDAQNLLTYFRSLLPDMDAKYEVFRRNVPARIAERMNDYKEFAYPEDLKAAISGINFNDFIPEDASILGWGQKAVELIINGTEANEQISDVNSPMTT